MNNLQPIIYALLGGVLPALVWLAFWLREDKKSPEPKKVIALTFFFGILSVLMVLPLQKMVDERIPGMALPAIILFVVIEEFFKCFVAWAGALRTKDTDEPIDPMIYLITAALGFSALENALFIFGWLSDGNVAASVSIIGGNLRFIGASLLHVVSSAFVGLALGLSFYKPRTMQWIYALFALVVATIFHSVFNFLIINFPANGTTMAFGLVWAGVILILLAFEKVKTIAR